MKAFSISELQGPAPEAETALAQVERILTSETFRDSPTQQRLLRYIAGESLKGDSGDLKEYNIGVSVFQRGTDFDPRTDSIVRVQIGVLRKRLANYYAAAGASDPTIVEIPKGHYVARFQPRVITDSAAPLISEVPRQQRSRGLHPLWYALFGLLAGLGLMLLRISLAPGVEPKASAMGREAREHPLWKAFLAPGSTSTLVVGAPLFFSLGSGMYLRHSQVNDLAQAAKSKDIRTIEEALHSKAIPAEVYTGLGEVVGVNLLGRFFQTAGSDLPLLRNRLTRWEDVTSGNLIFLASLRFHTLNQELNLPSDFVLMVDNGRPGIRNLHPRSGEQTLYMTVGTSDRGLTDYALVSMWPSTLPGRHIMKLAGTHTWGTQGAAEYVTDMPSLRKLKTKIQNSAGGWQEDVPLQILLEVKAKDDQVMSIKYLTHHWLAN